MFTRQIKSIWLFILPFTVCTFKYPVASCNWLYTNSNYLINDWLDSGLNLFTERRCRKLISCAAVWSVVTQWNSQRMKLWLLPKNNIFHFGRQNVWGKRWNFGRCHRTYRLWRKHNACIAFNITICMQFECMASFHHMGWMYDGVVIASYSYPTTIQVKVEKIEMLFPLNRIKLFIMTNEWCNRECQYVNCFVWKCVNQNLARITRVTFWLAQTWNPNSIFIDALSAKHIKILVQFDWHNWRILTLDMITIFCIPFGVQFNDEIRGFWSLLGLYYTSITFRTKIKNVICQVCRSLSMK